MSVYSDNYKLIRWAPLKPSEPVTIEPRGPQGPFLMPDITPFVAPPERLGGKPRLIGSRTQLRHYERATGTRQVGELKTVADFAPPEPKFNERAFDAAFKAAVEKVLGS